MEMDEGARKWMYKYIHKNYWKVATYMELEDLISEGFRCYYSTKNRYHDEPEKYGNDRVTNTKHLMALFQRKLSRKMTDLAKQRTKFSNETPLEDFFHPTGLNSNLVAEAPEPLRSALRVLLDGSGLERLREPYKILPNGRKETFNERICTITGLDPAKHDLPQMLKDHLETPKGRATSPIPRNFDTAPHIQEKLSRWGCSAEQIKHHMSNLFKIREGSAYEELCSE